VSDAASRLDPVKAKVRGRRGERTGPAMNRWDAATDVDLGDTANHLGYYLRRAQVWTFQDFIRAFSAVDIRPAQYSVLNVIAANPGVSQTAVARALGIERARLVRLLDKLEARGLTTRSKAINDRRSHNLHLTVKGRNFLDRLKSLADAHEARVAEKFGSENCEILRRLLAASTNE